MIKLVYFSPTHTTEKIVKAIGDGLSAEGYQEYSITFKAIEKDIPVNASDLFVFGMPVYGGRLPELVSQRLRNLDGNRARAIAVAVYGNRAYEDALLELQDLLTAQNFTVVSAAAFIGEHSFSTGAYPIAADRPDENDLGLAKAYGARLRERLAVERETDLRLPGAFPYKPRNPSNMIVPDINDTLCTRCQKCISVCPVQAISLANSIVTDNQKCIRCSACIKECAEKARSYTDPIMINTMTWLTQNCAVPRECEIFIG